MGSPSAPVLGFLSGTFFLFSVLLVNLPHRIANHDAVLQEIISHHHNNLERRQSSNSGSESESPDTGGANIQFSTTHDQARGPKNVIASLNMTVGEDGEEKSEYHIVSTLSEQKKADTEDARSCLVHEEKSATQNLQNQLPKFDPTPTSGLSSFYNLLNYGNTGSSSGTSANVLATAVPLLLQTHQQRVHNARRAAHTFFGLGVFFAFWCYFRSRYDTINSEHELILKKNAEAKKRERARRKEEKKKKQSESIKKAEGLGDEQRAAAGTVKADGQTEQ